MDEDKQKQFYKKNPEVIMYFAMDEGNIVFDFDDTKIDAYDAVLLSHNTVNEFLKSITEKMRQEQVQVINKNNTNIEEKK